MSSALKDKLARRFGDTPGFQRWVARQCEGPATVPAPAGRRLWEAAIVYRDGRPNFVLTPAGGVTEQEATSVYRTYRDTIDRSEGVVGIFPVREA